MSNKTEMIRFMVSPEMKDWLQNTHGRQVSEFLRDFIHKEMNKQAPSPQDTDPLQIILREPKSKETLVNTVCEIIQDYVKDDYSFQDYIDRKIRNTVQSMHEFG